MEGTQREHSGRRSTRPPPPEGAATTELPGAQPKAPGRVPNLPYPGPASQSSGRQQGGEPGAHTCRRQQRRGTHLRHISPVSVMLGCQILVKHFTLGGCNAEREREIEREISQARPITACPRPNHTRSSPQVHCLLGIQQDLQACSTSDTG